MKNDVCFNTSPLRIRCILASQMELLFIYNAKSDGLNAMLDFVHKILSPVTYKCNLCKLTHTNFGEHKVWKAFKEASSTPMTFYHIDEFEKLYSQVFVYPVVLKKEGNTLSELFGAQDIGRFKNSEELICAIKKLL